MNMRFLKNNFDSILKLFINQIGVAIFSFFLYTAAAAISTDASVSLIIKISISVFSILFYFVLIYNVTWEIGAKDKIRIDAKRIERNSSKGIGLGIFANAVNFIVIGCALFLYIFYLLFDWSWAYKIFVVLNAIFRIFVSMYLGVVQGICSSFAGNTELYYLVQTILFLVFSVISAIAIHLSYLVGLADFRLIKNSTKKK